MNMGKSLIAITFLLITGLVQAENSRHQTNYKITITNLTKGISFTPFIVATHKSGLQFFELGEAASPEIARIAEGGDIMPLFDQLSASKDVMDVTTTSGLLGPGESVSLQVSQYKFWKGRLSLAAMLIPTNDTFVSLNAVRLPGFGRQTYLAQAYDAGSETNDESCINIPGPTCGGEPFSPQDQGEGFVYPSPTTHGEGDLSVATYGWSGPVAKVTIEPMW